MIDYAELKVSLGLPVGRDTVYSSSIFNETVSTVLEAARVRQKPVFSFVWCVSLSQNADEKYVCLKCARLLSIGHQMCEGDPEKMIRSSEPCQHTFGITSAVDQSFICIPKRLVCMIIKLRPTLSLRVL